MIKIAPSILAADFAFMGRDVAMLEKAGADWIHFDVMDGHFTPNLSFGPGICAAIRPLTPLPIDVHLMVTKPGDWVTPFVEAGADSITFHVEAELHIQRQLHRIRDMGKKAGVVLNPATPIVMAEHVLEYCDLVLLMSVNPGFGGQSFLPFTLEKIASLRTLREKRGLAFEIEVDGGVNDKTARDVVEAGATVLVAGNAVFSASSPADMIKTLRCGG